MELKSLYRFQMSKNEFFFPGGLNHSVKSFSIAFTTSDTAQLPVYRKNDE